MNKSGLIIKLIERTGLNGSICEKAVGIILGTIKEALMDGGRVEIRGFGSFVVREYDAYEGRNPKTGEKIYVPPKKLPFFKVGKELRERIDK